MNQLDQIKSMKTIIVADTGDLNEIKYLKPNDATTNPSLILKACKDNEFNNVREVAVEIGINILNLVPGYVSTEVNPINSFDTEATINDAKEIIRLYKEQNVDTNRVLIKIAATWQGIKAGEILEKDGIKCNMTLIFSLTQARACAEAGVTLISPFVGRISDWYKENEIKTDEDPGVESIVEIFNYYKKYSYKTIVMGASFRNTDQITKLAGCDRLTISPSLLKELSNKNDKIESLLNINIKKIDKLPNKITQNKFYLEMAENKMATDKLNQGILKFIEDTNKLIKK